MSKFVAACLIAVTGFAVCYSIVDAEQWVANESIYIPLPEAIHYIASNISDNDSILILCPINNLNLNVAKFYLNGNEHKNNTIVLYPSLPPDSYSLNFNISEVSLLCKQKNVKYALLDENTGYYYFNSTVKAQNISDMVVASGNFVLKQTLGTAPYRVFVFQTKVI